MSKEINLYLILEGELSGRHNAIVDDTPLLKEYILDAMMEACKQTLELAVENAEGDIQRGYESSDDKIVINKQSILNTINQIKLWKRN